MPAKLLGATCMLAGLLTVAPGGPAMAQSQPVTFTKSFATNPIEAGASQTMTFTITSTSADQIFEIEFTDDLANFLGGITPTGIDLPANGFCGFGSHASASDSNGILEVRGAFLEANGSCEFSVGFIVPTGLTPGDYTNTTSELNAATGVESFPVNAPAATATLTVDAADAPVFSKAFSPDTIAPGGISRLTFTIDNGANLIDVGSLAFNDNFPDGMIVAPDPDTQTTCTGGTISAAAGGASVGYSGGGVAAGASCTVSVDVQAVGLVGPLENISGALTSDLPDAAPPASATLTVDEAPLIVSMGFSPSTIAQGGVSRLSYDLRNDAAVGATSISLSDTLPADVVVADAPNAATTCAGGVLTAPAGGDTIAFADGELAAGGACAISVDVTSAVAGSYSNGPETVTSSLGDSTAAPATLTVTAADAPVFSKAFSPSTIAPGGISRLTFTIDNGANLIDVGSLAFTDAFPAGLVVAGTPNGSTTCGGTFAPGASDVSLAFTGGAVAAGDACAISVDVTSAVAGSYPNTSGALTSDLPDAAPAATATLTVDEAPLIVSMGFSPSTIAQGGVSRLSYDLRNDAAVGATSISLSDTLPADVTVADAPNAATTCAGGVLTAPAGGDTIAFADGELAAGGACAISVDVTSAVAGSYLNGPESVTSSLGDSTAAPATLTVDAADAPVFSKEFSPSTIDPGGISRLTFTIDNGANLIDVGSLAFTDAFPSGLVVAGTPNGSTTCGGTFAPGASDVSLAFAGGAVAAGASCTISVDVTSAVAGSYPNTSGALTSDLPDAAPPASATLTVNEAPLIVSMGFTPSTIAQGGVSRLSYELNNGAAVGATSISLSDTLPADVTVADVPDASTTCAGGVLTAPAGGDTLAFADGELAAGGACAISVDVTSAVAGSYSNGPEAVTSSLGASTAAPAMLTVDAAAAPVFSKAFSPDTIAPGGISRLTFTIDNGANLIDVGSLAFTDAFPAGLVVAGTPNGSTTCGGTFAPGASDVSLAFTGGAVAAGDACAISVDVTSAVAGSYPNTSGALTSDLPDAPAATATLTVNEAPLVVSMGFSPSTIAQGGVSRLSYDLGNAAAVGATSISLSDTLPADVTVADAPNAATTCAGGVLTAPAGGDTLAFADGELAAGDTCAISVDVTSAVAGSYSNGPEAVTSSLGASTPVQATLTVDAADAPVFTKAFSPDTIAPGGISRLTFTIDNGANLIDVGSLAFTDAFPSGLVVAGTPNGSTTCGGTFAPGASDVSLAFAGGAVAAGDACAISVDVTSAVAGSYPNTSGALTSDLPDAAPPASATLTVNEAPLIVSMGFTPSTIAQGGVSRLSYELNNDAAVGATSISLSDTLPADVVVADAPNAATTCAGGVLTAPAGGDTLAFADGAVAAGGACAISVDVTSAVAGSYSNGPETVTSSLGASTPVQATLTVTAADAPVFSKAFSPDTIAPGGISRLTFTIDNGANLIDVGSLAFTDAFPSGLVVAGTPNGSTTCGGTFAPGASDVSLAFAGGAVAAGDACAISVDVTSAVAGSYPNTSGALTSDLPDAAPPASATLTVDEAPLIVSMGFSPSTIAQGGVSRLSYDLRNDAAVGATSISLSDTLPADVVVADAPNAATTCAGGVLTAPAGGDTLAFADGAVAAGGACAISVDVTSAVAGSYSNGPETVTSSLGASTPVQATLTVDAADAPVFTKAFSPDTIAPGGISRLTFTIDNGANLIDVGSLAFTDAFPSGLVVAGTPNGSTTCGGTFAPGASDVSLAFAGGAVAAGASCTISVDVTSAVAGSYPNTSGALTSDLPDAAPPASATLTVDEAPLIVSMGFSPSTIAQGGVSRLSYELNNGAAVGATSISLSDTLPADVTVADVPDASTTCAGGVLTAPAGGDTLAFADGELAAGGACAISVDVTSAVAGSYSNGPEAVTSSLGASTAAPAMLTVDAAAAPVFSKAFSPDTIAPGGISRLTFTIDNGANLIDVGSLAFTDAFPAGLVVAGTPNGSTTCGGTFAPGASDVSLAFTGGAVAAGDACAISVDVTSAVAGSYPNTSGALTSDLPDAPAATATLTVNEAPLVVSMGFSPSTIAQGGVSRLSYDLGNAAAVGATSISLSDTLPADVTVADAPNAATTCAGGVLTAPAGGDTLAFADGELAAGDTCAISVDVTSAVAGSYSNGPEAVTSSLGASTPVQATLTVDAADAPVFTKAFSPDTIAPGGISRLTFTIDNGANLIDVGSLAFTDAFPSGLVVAGTPNGSTTCGGTFAPGASDVSLAFAGGAVAAGDACAISVDVTSAVAGSYPNTSGALTSDLPDAAPPASATLTVNEAPLIVSMGFTPSTIAQGGVSRLSYELNNDAAVEATSISLSDTLPADVVVAGVPDASTTCGGTVTAAAGGDTVAFTGGAVAAGDACAISVDVTSAVAGSYLNGPETVTSSLGDSTPVSATLTVDAADAPVFTKAFSPDTIAPGGISRLTFTIDNGANAIEAADLAFTDAFPAGLVVAGTPNGSTTCGGTFAPGASDVSLAFAGGAVAAGDACAISVDVTSAVAGSYPNTSGALTSDLPDAPAATATLRVDEAPLIVSMGFSPSTIAQGGVSRLSYELNNGAAVGATSISLSDTLPADVVVADVPDARTTCGGTLTAAAGGDTVAFTGGAVAAGDACAISVDVTSAVAGSYSNGPEAVTSSLGASTPVSATLTVDAADAPVFTKAFSPDTIDPGGISRLTFTIDNGANAVEAADLAFTDAFPSGLVVADTPDVDNDCGGGTLTAAAGGDTLAFAGGAVAANAACEIRVTVRATGSAGPLTNTTSALESSLPDAPAATATLTVNEAPLIVSMGFTPSTIAQGGVSRLSYELNNDAAVEATSISLSDTLPADVVVAGVPDASTTCGGTVTAAAGGDTVAFTGGAVAAGDACAISVDVTSAVAGSYLNGPETVTSSLGDSTPVSATLTVDAADAPVFTKAFSPDTIAPGGISRLTFTIDNGANAIEAADLAFTDAFPAGLVVAGTPNGSTTCGGTFAPGASDVSLAFAGGAVAAGDACAISVDVTSAVAGSYPNTSGALTSDLPDAPAATATLRVDEAPLIVSMGFSPSTIAQGGVSRLSYELNNGAAVGATSISLSDTLPADVVVADVPDARTTCGGTLTAAAGGDTVAFTGGAVAAGDACAISVDVTSAVAGSYSNGPEAVTSSLGASTPVSATLTVDAADAPVFTKAFSPDTIDPGGISRLTFTIDNGANAVEAADLAFTDAFPSGLVVADTPDVDNDCGGGTLTAAAGGDTLAFAGGAVAANAACEIRVTVRATGSAGPLTNTTSALESSLPDAPAATATLTVNEAPLIVSMGFTPSTIAQGGVSRLSYELNNDAAVEATSISLSDTLPADVVVADVPDARTTCGGTLTAAAGGDTIALADGELAAGGACAISVDVTSAVAGSYSNGPEAVTSSLGASTPVSATLTVDAAVVPAFAGTVTFDVNSDIDGAFGFSSAEPGLTTSLEISGGTGSTGALPVATAGSYSVAVTPPAGVRLTAIACDDTDSTADMSAATVSVTVDTSEDVTCTITARSPVEETVETINRFLTRRADLILSSEPDPSRRFDRLKRGSGNTGPISFSNNDLKALLPFTAQGGNGDYGFSTSLPQARRAIASAALALGPDGDIAYVENHRFDAWFEAQYKEFDAGADRRGDFGIAYAGVDYLLTPDVLVGALVSFDTMEETTDTGTVSGDGWMAGPYMTVRLAPSLYFDGRLAAGESDNRISPFGVYTDEFPTGRWLSMASLTGEFQRGDWTIRPHASLSYLEERQKSYVDGVGATIPGRTVRLGQFKIGPAFTGRFEGAEGRIYSPYLKVDAIYNVGDTTGATPAEANDAEVEGWRARVKAGVSMTTEHGTRLSLGASHDGIGRSDFETWGLTFELSVPIGKPKAR